MNRVTSDMVEYLDRQEGALGFPEQERNKTRLKFITAAFDFISTHRGRNNLEIRWNPRRDFTERGNNSLKSTFEDPWHTRRSMCRAGRS
jgi:hypothetical protein